MTLVNNIKLFCHKQNITVRDLEKRAGLPAHSIYKWDKNVPGVDKVAAVANVLNTTVDNLINSN